MDTTLDFLTKMFFPGKDLALGHFYKLFHVAIVFNIPKLLLTLIPKKTYFRSNVNLKQDRLILNENKALSFDFRFVVI